MLRRLVATTAGSLVGGGLFFAGFWLLYLAFSDGSPLQGVGGGVAILLGLVMMANARGTGVGRAR